MYLLRPPLVYRWLFKEALFRKDPYEKKIYLTFDDGPHSEATEFVLSVLEEEGVKATFFMLGKNVKLHPGLVARTRKAGHTIANHGMEHLNGWNTKDQSYHENCKSGSEMVSSKLFRPPYGKLKLSQYKMLKEDNQLVFWDVISGDFDQTIGPDVVRKNVVKSVRNGSIIVMHDSAKALQNLRESLRYIIVQLKAEGYEFDSLD